MQQMHCFYSDMFDLNRDQRGARWMVELHPTACTCP
jgi:hypothetical protein